MPGIGTAANNYDEELKKLQQQQQQGIGTVAYHEPAGSIGTPAYHEPAGSISTPASKEPNTGIGTPASNLNQATGQKPIQTMEGVTAGTKQKMDQLAQGYQQSDAAAQAQQALQQIMNQKPQGYTSKYGSQLEGILQQLQGKKFNYSLNGDPFFQSLRDNKVQLAKQASMDAMGQAAGLTGGYGNSAAQAVGTQAYQNALLGLDDKAMEGYNLALQRFQIEQQGLGDQFNMLNTLEQQNYGQHRDTVSDYNTERNFAADMYNTEEDRGYNRYANDLNYWTQRAQIENADYRSEQERQEAIRQFEMQYAADQERFKWQQDVDQRDFDRNVLENDRAYNEQVRQFNESLDWDKMSAQQKYAADYALMMLQNGQMPSDEMLAAAGLSAEDAEKLKAQIATGGGGPGKQERPVYYVDIAGNYYQDDGKGGYVPVRPQDVDPNGLEDRSKINQITGQNLKNTWTAASNAQAAQTAQQNAALAAQRQAEDQAAKESRENIRQLLKGVDISKLFNR